MVIIGKISVYTYFYYHNTFGAMKKWYYLVRKYYKQIIKTYTISVIVQKIGKEPFQGIKK